MERALDIITMRIDMLINLLSSLGNVFFFPVNVSLRAFATLPSRDNKKFCHCVATLPSKCISIIEEKDWLNSGKTKIFFGIVFWRGLES